ncbi:hypothetical protein [Fodinibius halophilus]|uniref:Uncharacterized protein n=1 Tax=Fodinibius halophilus TaxID=1736908 RepID=A0A6M1THR6_9BACT|nr:hypothetical protein [Fodinibius halophilus]NGP89652.1 hypothetical protein [Fodinibius halophilus]
MKISDITIIKSFIVAISLSMVLIVGCDQGNSPDPLPQEPNERLSYAMAIALGNAEIRESVHSAMDASPYREHKLVFGQFLESSAGVKLQKTLAEELGGENKLNELLDKLPELDFYLPYETHRETWQHANSNLLVVCITDVDTTEAVAYHPDGSTQILSSSQQIKEAEIAAMFTLHPAEKKIHKNSSNSRERSHSVLGSQSSEIIQSNEATYVTKIANYTADGVFGGNCEFYFLARRLDESHATKSSQVSVESALVSALKNSDTPPTKETDLFIYDGPVSGSNKLKVRMYEADGGGTGGDDDYGYFIVDKPGDYDTSKNQTENFPKATVRLDNQ